MDSEEDDEIDKDGLRTNDQRDLDEKTKLVIFF